MIEMLPEERWPELKEIFAAEFDADLPNQNGAYILADVVDGDIKSFLVVEMLLRIGQIYSFEGSFPKGLFTQVVSTMRPETSIIAIASESRFERLLEKFKMRKVVGTIFRRDF